MVIKFENTNSSIKDFNLGSKKSSLEANAPDTSKTEFKNSIPEKPKTDCEFQMGKNETLNKHIVVSKVMDKGSEKNESKEKMKNEEDLKNAEIQHIEDLELTQDYLLRGVEAFFKLAALKKDNPPQLFEGKTDIVKIHIGLHKIPYIEGNKIVRRVNLPHSIIGESDVGLFVLDKRPDDDIKRSDDERIEHTVEYYQGILERLGITRVGAIIPVKQVKCEYDTFELKRRLASQFELFLCDSRLENPEFYKTLGKGFLKNNKAPYPIKLTNKGHAITENTEKKLKERLEDAVKKTNFILNKSTDNFFVRVGNMSMDCQDIAENIYALLDQMKNSKVLPGGHNNIMKVLLECTNIAVLPLYFDLRCSNDIQVPHVDPGNYKTNISVEGELSTRPRHKFTVLPTGDVFIVKKHENSDTDSLTFSDDDSDISEDMNDNEECEMKTEKVENIENKLGESEDESLKSEEGENDKLVNEAEEEYLANWSQEWLLKPKESEAVQNEDVAKKFKKKLKRKKNKDQTPNNGNLQSFKGKKLKK